MSSVADDDFFAMQLSVADSFGFTLTEIESMSLRKLIKWHDGIKALRDQGKGG